MTHLNEVSIKMGNTIRSGILLRKAREIFKKFRKFVIIELIISLPLIVVVLYLFQRESTAQAQGVTLPDFVLPYSNDPNEGKIFWTGGPHLYGDLITQDTIPQNMGSGIDFAGGMTHSFCNDDCTFIVRSMAEGDVVWMGYGSFGNQIAIKHTVGDTVAIYGHLYDFAPWIYDAYKRGEHYHVQPGYALGHAGKSGNQKRIHLHVELRDGSDTCTRYCIGTPAGLGGNPVGWHSVKVGNYWIFEYRESETDIAKAYNYDGVAVRINFNDPNTVPVGYEGFPYLDPDYYNKIPNPPIQRYVYTWLPPNFISKCTSTTSCEDDDLDPNVKFSNHGDLNGVGGAQLISSYAPPPSPKVCDPPTSPEGVFLFSEKNYCGYFSHFTFDDPDLGNDSVGNDNTWSIYIVGPYQVQLFRDPNYSGLSEVFKTGDPDLSGNDISNTASSLRVTYSTCSESSNGVTLYSSSNYGGICKPFTSSDSDLSDDGFNDSTWSLRINGSYKVTLFQDPNFSGVSEVFLQNDVDLHDNQIFNTASSMRIEEMPCNETAGGVVLYPGANFIGACKVFTSDVPDLTTLNDSVWSIKINGSYRATIYGDPNFTGSSENFLSSDPDLHDNSIYNTASSLKVTPVACNPDGDGVTLFAGTNYSGVCQTYTGDGASLSNGMNDYVWSIRVKGPYRATLYRDPNYTGVSEKFDWEDADLHDNQIYNTSSSIKVEKITCDPGSGGITLYAQPDFGGPCTTFKQSDPDLSDNGIGNDNTYSVKIIGPYTGSLYLDPNYQGQSISLNNNISDMRGSTIVNGSSSLKIIGSPNQLALLSDLNNDGVVNILDYTILSNAFGWTGTPGAIAADINIDGVVNILDYTILSNNFGHSTISNTQTNTKYLAPLSVPVPPSNVSFSSENNPLNTAIIVRLVGSLTLTNGDGFRYLWNMEGYSSGLINYLFDPSHPPSPISGNKMVFGALAVIPCESKASSRTITASVKSYNTEGESSPTSVTGSVVIPTCPVKRIYLPAIEKSISIPDGFDSAKLSSEWQWIDPLGDSNYSLIAHPGYLRLSTPDRGHDLYMNLDAPRMVRLAAGDFTIKTKVTINPQYNYQGAGLLIWLDSNNYFRLERTLVNGIDIWYRVGGNFQGKEISFSNPTVYLKLARRGINVTASYSVDNSSWINLSPINFPAYSTVQVGMVLINEWQDNAIYADFDYFEILQ